MDAEVRHGLAWICYGLAAAMVGGFIYAFDGDVATSIGGLVVFLGALMVLAGLVGAGRALGRD